MSTTPKIEVLVDVDPDGGTDVTLWFNGQEFTPTALETVDPGAGHQSSEWRSGTREIGANTAYSRAFRDATLEARGRAATSDSIQDDGCGDEFSMIQAATAIQNATGLATTAGNSGGGVQTLYVGTRHLDAAATGSYEVHALIAGPGWNTDNWPDPMVPTASTDEFTMSPDEEVVGAELAAELEREMPVDCADPIAWCVEAAQEILAAVRSRLSE